MNNKIQQLEQLFNEIKDLLVGYANDKQDQDEQIQKKKDSLATKDKILSDKEVDLNKREKKLAEDLRSADLKINKVRTDEQLALAEIEANKKFSEATKTMEEVNAKLDYLKIREEELAEKEQKIHQREKGFEANIRQQLAENMLKSAGISLPLAVAQPNAEVQAEESAKNKKSTKGE